MQGAASGKMVALLGLILGGCLVLVLDQLQGRKLSTELREDVTSPHVKHAFLSKFDSAKAHHVGKKKSLLLDPLSVLEPVVGKGKGKGKGKGGKKPLSAAQRAAIAARMKALRESILNDFSSNTKFGKRVDCSYPYPAASCKGHHLAKRGQMDEDQAIPMAFGKAR